jgi:uncharacterized protein (TIGR02246 family)
MFKKIGICAALFVSSVSFASTEDEIRNFFAQTTAALNLHDLDAIAGAWTEKGELVSLAGGIYAGRGDIRSFFQDAFANSYAHAAFENLLQYVRVSGETRATVDGVWKIKGGPANYPGCGIFVYNLVKENAGWKIEFANSSVPRPGHSAEHGRMLSWIRACQSRR